VIETANAPKAAVLSQPRRIARASVADRVLERSGGARVPARPGDRA